MKTKTNGKYTNPSSHTGPYTEYVCDELIRGDGEPVIASRCCPYDCPGNRPPVDADAYDKAVDELMMAISSDIDPVVHEFMIVRKKPDAVVPIPQLRCSKYIELIAAVESARGKK